SGTNYVIPVDAGLAHVDDVEFEAVELSKLLSALNRAGALKLVILDACRNNPFKKTMASTGTTRSVGRGLARVNPVGSDTLVAYAAKEGTLADDGTGNNSPYAAALIKHLTTPGLDVRLMFGRVRDDVLAATGRRQEPFTYGSLGGEAIFLAPPDAVSTPSLQTTPASPARDREVVFWDSIKSSTVASDFEAYLESFPGGTFEALAKSRLERLKSQEAATEAERRKKQASVNNKAKVKTKKTEEASRIQAEARTAWQRIWNSTSVPTLENFVSTYSSSMYANMARARILELERNKEREIAALQIPTKERVLPRAGSRSPKTVGRRGNWGVVHFDQDDAVVCYIYTRPSRSSPRGRERKQDDISFLVRTSLHRSKKDAVREPSAIFGTLLRNGDLVSVEIDDKKFQFFAHEDSAFLYDQKGEPAFIEAMKAGSRLTLTGKSRSGNTYKDQFSLRGVTKALDLLNQICPPGT
ncbi:MAG: caspase family protein, partial [Pseudomonadota bacterium]